MATFPTSIPSYLGFTAGHTLAVDTHAAQHNQEQADITALATKVGTGASTPTSGLVLTASGTGTSAWSPVNLTTMVSGVLPIANGGTGTTSTTGTGSVVYSTGPTISNAVLSGKPTVTDFTNAQHTHQNAAGGGLLLPQALPALDLSLQTISNPYKFHAHPTSDITGIGGTTTTVTLGTEDYDTGSNFAASTFTAPIAGFYQFNANVVSTNTAGLYTGLTVGLLKNGTTTLPGSAWFDNNVSLDFCTGAYNDCVLLAAGDTIVLRAQFVLVSGTGGFSSTSVLSGFLVSTT